MRQLACNATEDGVVQVPCLVQISNLVGVAVCGTPVAGIVKVATKRLGKGNLSECAGSLMKIRVSLQALQAADSVATYLVDQVVQRFQSVEHALDIIVAKVPDFVNSGLLMVEAK